MRLEEFIAKNVAPNSIIRLWIEHRDKETSGHLMLSSKFRVILKLGKFFMFPDTEHPDGYDTGMSWEVSNNKFGNFVYLYRNEEVLHVTSILSNTSPDAINIVLDDRSGNIKRLNQFLNQNIEDFLKESSGKECVEDAPISEKQT